MTWRRALCGMWAGAVAACASTEPPPIAEFAALSAPAADGCAVARDADFDGAGAAALQQFAVELARTHGAEVALQPREVAVAILDGPPKPGLVGVTAGEVSCGDGSHRGPYRIALYREALAGRPLYVAYRTVAHEMHHLVQIRRDRLPCGATESAREAYEREAAAVAEQLVPDCHR